MKGLLWTAAGLIVFEVLVTSTPAAEIGGAFGAVTTWIQEWMSPQVPLIKAAAPAAKAAAVTTTPVPPASRLPAPSVPITLA